MDGHRAMIAQHATAAHRVVNTEENVLYAKDAQHAATSLSAACGPSAASGPSAANGLSAAAIRSTVSAR